MKNEENKKDQLLRKMKRMKKYIYGDLKQKQADYFDYTMPVVMMKCYRQGFTL